MPAGLVEHDDRMCFWSQTARDLIKMMLHGLRVGARHDNRRSGAALGTDRAEPIGRFGAQVSQGSWPAAAPCPAPCARVFLAEAHLVLKPDFYRRFRSELRRDLAHKLG